MTKRHWLLSGVVILAGSWITHTTTARIYSDVELQHEQQLAEGLPNYGNALTGGLPNELFLAELQTVAGPISDANQNSISPADFLFDVIVDPLTNTDYQVKRGDTLGNIFKQHKLDLSLPHAISQHPIAKQLVSLSVNRTITFGHNEEQLLKEISYPLSSLQTLIVAIEDDKISDAFVEDLPYKTVEKSVSAQINSSLYEAGLESEMSISSVMEMVRIFGWDVDFAQDIRKGDNFHAILEEKHHAGEKVADGPILAAQFTTQGTTYKAFRFDDGGDNISYYNQDGESMLGTFLRSPVEFSRISSRFGKRKHPILKKWRAHKGVDYAAGRGTPIRATADGKVIHAGNKGGYGRTVVLRHAGRFSTLYAHMNGYAKGVKSGRRVKQGDVIGYIGSSGLATGPHLHYEFRLDGVHRNPLTFKTPKATAVPKESLAAFMANTQIQTAKLDHLATANIAIASAQQSMTSKSVKAN